MDRRNRDFSPSRRDSRERDRRHPKHRRDSRSSSPISSRLHYPKYNQGQLSGNYRTLEPLYNGKDVRMSKSRRHSRSSRSHHRSRSHSRTTSSRHVRRRRHSSRSVRSTKHRYRLHRRNSSANSSTYHSRQQRGSNSGSGSSRQSIRSYNSYRHKKKHVKKRKTRRRSSSRNERRREKVVNGKNSVSMEREGSDESGGHDDTIGMFEGKPGEYIDRRYKILREAGVGTFGRVLECHDRKRNIIVAIKVVRKVAKYTESAQIEAKILEDVNDQDVDNTSLCVKLYKWFEYEGHVCLVFERLGCSLYEYLKTHDYKPFPLPAIRSYAWQLLTSLAYIHSIKLIHTDLKPENILFVDDKEAKPWTRRRRSSSSFSSAHSSSVGSVNAPSSSSQASRESGWTGKHRRKLSSESDDIDDFGRLALRPPLNNAVKLIDFGGATYDDESKSTLINTRQYRSPEVILGLGWSFPSDIWSAGCILAELYLGELLFATHENLEHLALIERCIGKLPMGMVARASPQGAKFFHRNRLNWPEGASSEESIEHVRSMRTLAQLISREHATSGLLELLELMLVLDPDHRVTAKEALNHPFFEGCTRENMFHLKDCR